MCLEEGGKAVLVDPNITPENQGAVLEQLQEHARQLEYLFDSRACHQGFGACKLAYRCALMC